MASGKSATNNAHISITHSGVCFVVFHPLFHNFILILPSDVSYHVLIAYYRFMKHSLLHDDQFEMEMAKSMGIFCSAYSTIK